MILDLIYTTDIYDLYASLIASYLSKLIYTRGINEELSNFATSFLTGNPYKSTVGNNWQKLKDTLLYIVDKYVPSKHLNIKKQLPWISKDIKLQMKQRKSLYDKAKQTQATSDWREYRKARNQVNKALSAAYQQYSVYSFV